jgi:hypothetical protein
VPDTVTEAIELLRGEGYTANFQLVDGALRIDGRQAVCQVGEAEVERLYRFEGPSGPGDMMVVLALRDPASGTRGTLAAAYGPAADPDLYVHLAGPSDAPGKPVSLEALVERIPEGWTAVVYQGRRYGLTRTTRVGGGSISVLAEELGGPDLISANVYRTSEADHLRPCEMPAAKVIAFLEGWKTAPSAD